LCEFQKNLPDAKVVEACLKPSVQQEILEVTVFAEFSLDVEVILHFPVVDKVNDMFVATKRFEDVYFPHLASPVLAPSVRLLGFLHRPDIADRLRVEKVCCRSVVEGGFHPIDNGKFAIAVHVHVSKSSRDRGVHVIL